MEIELQGNQIHLAFEPPGRSRRKRLELIYEMIKFTDGLLIQVGLGEKN